MFVEIFEMVLDLVRRGQSCLSQDLVLPLHLVFRDQLWPFMYMLVFVLCQVRDILVNYSFHLSFIFDTLDSTEFVILLPIKM